MEFCYLHSLRQIMPTLHQKLLHILQWSAKHNKATVLINTQLTIPAYVYKYSDNIQIHNNYILSESLGKLTSIIILQLKRFAQDGQRNTVPGRKKRRQETAVCVVFLTSVHQCLLKRKLVASEFFRYLKYLKLLMQSEEKCKCKLAYSECQGKRRKCHFTLNYTQEHATIEIIPEILCSMWKKITAQVSEHTLQSHNIFRMENQDCSKLPIVSVKTAFHYKMTIFCF